MNEIIDGKRESLVKKLKVWHRLIGFFKAEAVMLIAFFAAFVSAIFNPPTMTYLSYIDYKVLLCLFCLMVVVAGLKKVGVFEVAASFVAQKSKNLRGLTLGILLLTFFFAMFMTNDVALITMVPFTLILLNKIGQNDYAILIIVLQTIGANIGSSLTPVGNPQNLYLFSRYHLSLGEFILILLPIVFAGGILLCLSTLFVEKKSITVSDESDAMKLDKGKLLGYSILFILSVFAVFNILPILWVSGLLFLCILLFNKELFREVDYSLLFTFVGFFIFVGNLSELPAVAGFLARILTKSDFFISVLTSQIISNVPAAILLSGFTQNYRELLLGVNVGGLGTLIASLASVISYKIYTKAHPKLSRQYLKVFTLFNLVFLLLLIGVVGILF